MQSTLVLNASYEPLSIVSARRAVQLLVAGRAIAVSESGSVFHSATGEIALPWVIRLNHFVKRPANVRQAKFSRRGVMVRDGYTCVYCGKHAETIDHVTPRTYGGLSTYENCVAACVHCNRKKGHKTLAELNWSLPVVPKTPTPLATMLGLAHRNDEQLAAWGEYIIMFQPELAPLLQKPVAIPVGG